MDELNLLISNLPSEYENKIDVEEYMEEFYSTMQIDEDQKEKRKRVARQVRDAIIFLFLLIRVTVENEQWNYNFVLNQFRNEFRDILSNNLVIDYRMESYIQEFTQNYLDTTIEHLSMSDAAFFMSEDRAIIGGANESNTIIGYAEYEEAIENGYTQKRWKTERDNRVRKTQKEMEGKTIPIDDYFVVGGSALLYPCDPEGSEKETANCRCVLEYL